MRSALSTLTRSPRWRLSDARVPRALIDAADALPAAGDGLVRADLSVADGRIAAILPPGSGDDAPVLDLQGAMVWPGLVDCHTHLDKGQIWPRTPNPDGTFMGALEATREDRTAHWTFEDVRRRMEFAVEAAHAHGTVAIRTHLDTEPIRMEPIWDAFRAVQADWRGRVDLQCVPILDPGELDADEGFRDAVMRQIRQTPGAGLGAFILAYPEHMAALPGHLDRLFRLAAEDGIALDLHVDETTDPRSMGLRAVAEAALRARFDGPLLCGHCVAPAIQPEAEMARTLDLAAEAGVTAVSLPLCNEYLMDRAPGRTPRLRGVAPVHEMAARDIPIAIGSDNTRDPFHVGGDLDLLEVYRAATRILHLDHPVGDWPAAIAARAGRLIGREGAGRIARGGAADLIVLDARGWSEFLARPQTGRVVIRAGRVLDATAPAYRTLDDLDGMAGATDF